VQVTAGPDRSGPGSLVASSDAPGRLVRTFRRGFPAASPLPVLFAGSSAQAARGVRFDPVRVERARAGVEEPTFVPDAVGRRLPRRRFAGGERRGA